eukprot:gene16531-22759_t
MSEVSKLSELPHDVITDIVLRALRLVPSFGDLSVVCKQWRGLISQNLVQVLIDRGEGDIPPLVERALSHDQFSTARGLAERIDSLEQNSRLLRSVSATGHIDIAGSGRWLVAGGLVTWLIDYLRDSLNLGALLCGRLRQVAGGRWLGHLAIRLPSRSVQMFMTGAEVHSSGAELEAATIDNMAEASRKLLTRMFMHACVSHWSLSSPMGGSFTEASDADVYACLRLPLELVFAHGVRQLHRPMLNMFKRLSINHKSVLGRVVADRIQQDVDAFHAAEKGGHSGGTSEAPGGQLTKKVVLAPAMASLLWLQEFQQWSRPCCVGAVQVISVCIERLLDAADAGLHVPPSLMQEVQDGISVLYNSLQHHGAALCHELDGGHEAIVQAAAAMFRALQGRALVREAMASAASVVWLASLLPSVPPAAAATRMASGLFFPQPSPGDASVSVVLAQPGSTGSVVVEKECDVGVLGSALQARGSSLAAEPGSTGSVVVEKECDVGVLGSALQARGSYLAVEFKFKFKFEFHFWGFGVLAQPGSKGSVLVENGTATLTPYSFLTDGALQYGVAQVADAPDSHYKYHASCVVNICMQRVLLSWTQYKSSYDDADADAGGGSNLASKATAMGTGGLGQEGAAPSWQPAQLGGGDCALLMSMLWANLDEPMAQTTRQVHESFSTLLDILATQRQQAVAKASMSATDGTNPATAAAAALAAEQATASYEGFLERTSVQLLSVSYTRKGRYPPLSSLVATYSARAILKLQPSLIRLMLLAMQARILYSKGMIAFGLSHLQGSPSPSLIRPMLLAMQDDMVANDVGAILKTDDMVANAVGAFLKTVLYKLREECSQDPWNSSAPATDPQTSIQPGDSQSVAANKAWMSWWLPTLLQALYSGSEKLRGYVATHALPVVLGLDPATAATLICSIAHDLASGAPEPVRGTSHIAALISVMKASRQAQILASLDAPDLGMGLEVGVLDVEEMLDLAIGHSCEAVRVECLALAAVSPRAAQPPGRMELKVAARWVDLSLRSTSLGQRNICISLFTKLLQCVRMSIGCLLPKPEAADQRVRMSIGCLLPKPEAADQRVRMSIGCLLPKPEAADQVSTMSSFMHWLTRHLVAGLYPGAPCARKILAIELLNVAHETLSASAGDAGGGGGGGKRHRPSKAGRGQGGQISDTADSLDSLCWYPGFTDSYTTSLLLSGISPAELEPLVAWATRLLWSPRQRDSDAGALLLRLINNKYVLQLYWCVELAGAGSGSPPCAGGPGGQVMSEGPGSARDSTQPLASPVVGFSQAGVGAKVDAGGARFTAMMMFLESALKLVSIQLEAARVNMAAACRRSLAHETSILSVSQVKGMGSQLLRILLERTAILSVSQVKGMGSQLLRILLDVKHNGAVETAILSVSQVKGMGSQLLHILLEGMGSQLLRILLDVKHNGVVEKASTGLLALAQRLLVASSNPQLTSLPSSWLATCMRRMSREGQCLDDIVRRSAGLPFAVGALLQSEPYNTPKALLPKAMSQLLSTGTGEGAGAQLPDGSPPWPRVHSFNILRNIFNDSRLAVDTSAFFAEGIQACIAAVGSRHWQVRNSSTLYLTALVACSAAVGSQHWQVRNSSTLYLTALMACIAAMGSQHWQVRNSSTLCLTALVVRVLGLKNTHKWEAGKKAVSGAEFFQRYPVLHTFFLSELAVAVESLTDGNAAPDQPPHIHPSLYPILIVLSRLKPGGEVVLQGVGEGGRQALSPAAFVPLVRRCGAAASYAIRQLAAWSLCPLVTAGTMLETVVAGLFASIENATGGGVGSAAGGLKSTAGGLGQPVQLPGLVSPNALQGHLMQLHALLEINATGIDSAALSNLLAIVVPRLAAMASLAAANTQHPLTSNAAVAMAYFRAVASTMRLLPPVMEAMTARTITAASSQGQHDVGHSCLQASDIMGLVTAAERVCEHRLRPTIVVVPTGGDCTAGGTAPTMQYIALDGFDPMHAVSLKEGTNIWLGEALHCRFALLKLVPSDPRLSAMLESRLAVCFASGSYDVRAAASKQLLNFLDALPPSALGPKQSASTAAGYPDSDANDQASIGGQAGFVTKRERGEAVGMFSSADPGGPTGGALDASSAAVSTMSALAGALVELAGSGGEVAEFGQRVGVLVREVLAKEAILKVKRRLLCVMNLLSSSTAVSSSTRTASTALPVSAASTAQGGPAAPIVTAGTAHASESNLAFVCSLYETGRGLDSRSEALKCWGSALGQCTMPLALSTTATLSPPSPQLLSSVEAFAAIVSECTEPSQPELLRFACAEALAGSGILTLSLPFMRGLSLKGQGVSSSSPCWQQLALVSLTGWRSVILLMEDEDEDIRQLAGSWAQKSLDAHAEQLQWLEAGEKLALIGAPPSGPGVKSRDLFVEVVLRQSVAFVASYFGMQLGLAEAFDALAQMVCDSTDTLPGMLQCTKESSSMDKSTSVMVSAVATHRLFDRELDNQHEEPLLLAQLASQQLHHCLSSLSSQRSSNSSCQEAEAGRRETWGQALLASTQLLRQRCLAHLCTAADSLLALHKLAGSNSSGTWIGGLVNHPEAFVPLYRLLLAVWAAGPPSSDSASPQAQVRDALDKLALAGLSGPLQAMAEQVAQ